MISARKNSGLFVTWSSKVLWPLPVSQSLCDGCLESSTLLAPVFMPCCACSHCQQFKLRFQSCEQRQKDSKGGIFRASSRCLELGCPFTLFSRILLMCNDHCRIVNWPSQGSSAPLMASIRPLQDIRSKTVWDCSWHSPCPLAACHRGNVQNAGGSRWALLVRSGRHALNWASIAGLH